MNHYIFLYDFIGYRSMILKPYILLLLGLISILLIVKSILVSFYMGTEQIVN